MEEYTGDFSLDVQGVKGSCPTGETYAKQQMAAKTTPVLTCEGPCIRGEIARLAGNLIARDVPSLARACHAEAFYVPLSSMASWVKTADKVVMIDGGGGAGKSPIRLHIGRTPNVAVHDCDSYRRRHKERFAAETRALSS